MTVASNQFQNHNQLLRHGMLNWVTRGVFLGYQRNYLEVQVDDLFLGDDAWDPATHTHQLRPGRGEPDDAGRRRPGDRLEQGARAAAGLGVQRRRERALRGPGRRRHRPAGGQVRPAVRSTRRSASSTTPTSTRTSTARPTPYIARQITDNLAWAQTPRDSGDERRPSWSPVSTPASPTRARATPARSTRRRSTTSTPRDRRSDPRRASTTTR